MIDLFRDTYVVIVAIRQLIVKQDGLSNFWDNREGLICLCILPSGKGSLAALHTFIQIEQNSCKAAGLAFFRIWNGKVLKTATQRGCTLARD